MFTTLVNITEDTTCTPGNQQSVNDTRDVLLEEEEADRQHLMEEVTKELRLLSYCMMP